MTAYYFIAGQDHNVVVSDAQDTEIVYVAEDEPNESPASPVSAASPVPDVELTVSPVSPALPVSPVSPALPVSAARTPLADVTDRHANMLAVRANGLVQLSRARSAMVKKRERLNGNQRRKHNPAPPIVVGSCVGIDVPREKGSVGLPRLPGVVVSLSGENSDLATIWCPAGLISTK
jgi:hypothetical protein